MREMKKVSKAKSLGENVAKAKKVICLKCGEALVCFKSSKEFGGRNMHIGCAKDVFKDHEDFMDWKNGMWTYNKKCKYLVIYF